jgi:hypothetical protein
MELFHSILKILDYRIEKPVVFGWFHWLWIGLTILVAVALCVWHKRSGTEDRVRRVVMGNAIFVIILEIYKMINYSFLESNGYAFDFQWYAFPWQFCSTPMYVGLLAGIIRKGKVHESLMAYLATFSVFAGLCVTIYPGDVFIEVLGINIQSMICHASMISVGVYLFYSGYVKLEHKTILKAIPVFAVCVTIALVLNEVVYHSGILNGEAFNMFYISPYFDSTLPIYGAVHNAVSAPWNIVIYILGFSLAAYVILLIAMGIGKIAKLATKKQKATV